MRRVLLAVFIVLLTLAAACSDDSGTTGATSTTEADEPTRGGTLRFGLASETSGFDPAEDQVTLSGYQITNAVYDRLVAYDENADWQPYLAESFVADDDFTTWTITLRPDIEFHDGTPLTAEVLAMNLQETKDSPLLGQVFGAVETIEVVDELTVDVNMGVPWASFPHTLTAQPGLIAAPSVYEEPDGGQRPVGTGPFVFEEWIRDQRLVVSRNDDYWREGYPLLDGIEFQVIVDADTRSASLESGDIDIAEIRDGSQIAAFEEDDGFDVYFEDGGEVTEEVLFFNLDVAPFDDPLAREAVAAAVDRQEISDLVYDGRYPPAAGPFKENSPWYTPVEYPDLDLERAEELAGRYESENGSPLSFVITTTPSPSARQLAEVLQQQLDRAGIEMRIESLEPTTALLNVLGGDFQAGTTNALFGSTHPDREYTFLYSDNALPPGEGLATGFARLRSTDVDEGLDAARESDVQEMQTDAWGRVQQALADELAFLFLVHDDVGDVAVPEVRDVVNWTLPDGAPGLPQEQNVVSVYQIWLAD